MSSRIDVLIDSDAFVGRYYPKDGHFMEASAIFAKLEEKQYRAVTTSMVIAETATVLSHHDSQALACDFIRKVEESNLPVIHISEALQKEATKVFLAQSRRGTSMTDCANVAVMNHFGVPAIFSFDKVYSRDFGLKIAA